jgi:hypothetical protein
MTTTNYSTNEPQGDKLRTYTVFGRKVRAHSAICADSFRQDRKSGLIYPPVCDADNRSLVYGWEEGSRELGFCVYCG